MAAYVPKEVEVKINFYVEHARIQIDSLKGDMILFDGNRRLLKSALDSIEKAFEVLVPYLVLETYSPFANHLNKLANKFHSLGLEKESELTQKIHKDLTQKVLRNIL
jgi:hypothetical protein